MELLAQIFAPVQLLAWVAAIIYIISYQKQSADKTIKWWIPADILMVIHMFFMGAPLFILISIGGTLRSIISLQFSRKILKIYLAIYMLAVVCAFPFLGEGLRDIMGVIGTGFFSLSVLMKHNFIVHRLFALGHQLSWIGALSILGSFGGLALILFMLTSNVIGTGRYLLKKRNETKTEETIG